MSRWTKKSTLKTTFEMKNSLYRDGIELDEKKTLTSDLLSEMHFFVNLIDDDCDSMKRLLGVIRDERAMYLKTDESVSHSKL